jgi:hypothetical protein
MEHQIEPTKPEWCTISSNPVKDSLIFWFAERASQDENVKELLVEFLEFAENQQRVENKE